MSAQNKTNPGTGKQSTRSISQPLMISNKQILLPQALFSIEILAFSPRRLSVAKVAIFSSKMAPSSLTRRAALLFPV